MEGPGSKGECNVSFEMCNIILYSFKNAIVTETEILPFNWMGCTT